MVLRDNTKLRLWGTMVTGAGGGGYLDGGEWEGLGEVWEGDNGGEG